MNTTRSCNKDWLIVYPLATIFGARLPSGRDVMRNFSFYHRVQKLTIVDSAKQVYTNLVPFWIKSRLPIRQKQHVIRMIKDLYEQHVKLMKNFRRSTKTSKIRKNIQISWKKCLI